jgi:nucleoside-diphosphate-sugar epimerase
VGLAGGVRIVSPLAGRRVLVTGASGFIGGRIAERLVVECGAQVRVTVRSVARAATLSRFPFEIAIADLRDRDAVVRAVDGCDVVIHCALGNDGTLRDRRAVDVDGTKNLLDASVRSDVSSFVHTSTVAVYENPGSGVLDETSPPTKSRDPYAVGKREGERVALGYASQLPVTVVQPTTVYGPRAGVHGSAIISELVSSRIPLPAHGEGICNAVYIDDLVTAMLLAATSDRVRGERLLISGPEYPTWREFYGAFERMLGLERTVPMSEADALALWKRDARRRWLVPDAWRVVRTDAELRRRLLETHEGAVVRRVAERVLPQRVFAPERWEAAPEPEEAEPPLAAFKPEVVRMLASTARVRIEKARASLGYDPAFGLAAGMRLTEAWARWAGLVPE